MIGQDLGNAFSNHQESIERLVVKLGFEASQMQEVKTLKVTSKKLLSTFSMYKDLIDLRLDEFRVNPE